MPPPKLHPVGESTLSTRLAPVGHALQGACLYVPATHARLDSVLEGEVPERLRVVVVCLEDSISPDDVGRAVQRLRRSPARFQHTEGLRVYVRPRSPEMLADFLGWEGGETRWCGFVLPKISTLTLPRWLRVVEHSSVPFMPILETVDVFCPFALRDLTDVFVEYRSRQRIDAVRLGAVDLFSVIGTRRPKQGTLYDTHLGSALASVACMMMSRGLPVTAPVCEMLDPTPDTVLEIRRDVEAGFIGKTAVNLRQAILINSLFAVTLQELSEAEAILKSEVAVFRSGGVMCEVSPHRNWAQRILARHQAFGVIDLKALGAHAEGLVQAGVR
jgi:citrate lyase beta subunit